MELVFDIIQSVSIIIASTVAIYGISSWRMEARWKRKYELAEEVLSLFYDIKERIQVIRSPVSYVGEGKTRKRGENEPEEVSEILDNAYVVFERYEKEKSTFIKLMSMKYRFMAVYGKSTGVPFDDLSKLTNKILFSAKRLGTRHWRDQEKGNFTNSQFEQHLKKMHELEAIIWSGFSEEDKVANEVDLIIKKIERICREVITKK